MSAWIYAFDNPYHSTTAEDGSYEIKTDGLKDGTYTIVAWQEKLGESQPQKVTVKGGKADKPVNFTFKAKAAMAPQAAPAGGPRGDAGEPDRKEGRSDRLLRRRQVRREGRPGEARGRGEQVSDSDGRNVNLTRTRWCGSRASNERDAVHVAPRPVLFA